MELILKKPIVGAAAWSGAELINDKRWIHPLSDAAIAELDQALAGLQSRQLQFPNFSAADFPLPGLRVELQRHADELESGRGFVMIRGLPVERYTEQQINAVYYGLGLNTGLPVRQNPKGDLLGLVMNVGDRNSRETRVYETNAYLPYHTDPSDVFGLLCVRKARDGGLSSLVSVASVYNKILQHYPEYLALFYRPVYYAHLGKKAMALSPIFSYHDDKLSCRYLRQYIELGCDTMGLPLSRVEVAALDLFDSITHDQHLRLDMMLEPGDILLANNYAVLHSRTAFDDYEETDKRRKLLRLWLKMPNARTLAADFPGRNGFPAPTEDAQAAD